MFNLNEEFLSRAAADRYLDLLRKTVDWQQDTLKLFGREHRIPRLHQWYADEGVTYRWSGLSMQACQWIEPLQDIREQLEAATGERFNSVLVNLYRDGKDSMGWHADDEPELGSQPTIASISLGAERELRLRRKDDNGVTETLSLPHGSLLLMAGNSQHEWQHSLPKRRRVKEPRINLTYRNVLI
ncbi:MAG: alpha-ketoglutarate-dependent dioxygenase AlkB family protein [Gammaproteobacteria bacterium]